MESASAISLTFPGLQISGVVKDVVMLDKGYNSSLNEVQLPVIEGIATVELGTAVDI